ncbi:MAG: SPW repeat protein [Patescibacteria group bacterium]
MRIFPWINILVGIWLIMSPFVLKYPYASKVMWGNLISGVIVIVFGLILATIKSRSDQEK